jgi:hypothetical protein
MPYKIHYLENEKLLETLCEGKLTVPNIFMAIKRNLVLSRRYAAHYFLVDCTLLIDETEKVFENYEVGTFMANLLPRMPNKFRNAIIMPPGEIARANFRFYETVTQNRGLNIRVFETRDDALAWLYSA